MLEQFLWFLVSSSSNFLLTLAAYAASRYLIIMPQEHGDDIWLSITKLYFTTWDAFRKPSKSTIIVNYID
jgi:hypothetical protein